jgi:hypothetical protein
MRGIKRLSNGSPPCRNYLRSTRASSRNGNCLPQLEPAWSALVRAEQIEIEVERLVRKGLVVELARDDLIRPSYSTPKMIALERDLVRLAYQLSRRHPLRPNVEHSRDLCRDCKLNAQQTEAVLAATAPIKTVGSSIAYLRARPDVSGEVP